MALPGAQHDAARAYVRPHVDPPYKPPPPGAAGLLRPGAGPSGSTATVEGPVGPAKGKPLRMKPHETANLAGGHHIKNASGPLTVAIHTYISSPGRPTRGSHLLNSRARARAADTGDGARKERTPHTAPLQHAVVCDAVSHILSYTPTARTAQRERSRPRFAPRRSSALALTAAVVPPQGARCRRAGTWRRSRPAH